MTVSLESSDSADKKEQYAAFNASAKSAFEPASMDEIFASLAAGSISAP